jgi:threonylcarbamoyladenosine tRNA methylthiotransferase MtaB
MKTFSIQTLGCKVNQYESEQIATLLRSRGLVPCADDSPIGADLRVINTCSVTIQAASKSRQAARQTLRRSTRLPVLADSPVSACTTAPEDIGVDGSDRRPRTILTGCWATSDREEALGLAGVDAVLGHHDDVAAELNQLLDHWLCGNANSPSNETTAPDDSTFNVRQSLAPQRLRDERLMIQPASAADQKCDLGSQERTTLKAPSRIGINSSQSAIVGTRTLPLLDQHQGGHQRAFVKVQDGCDAHCTYCIIPQLRPALWSKPIGQVVDEAKRLVDAGHVEIVLSGIFLGAYGQSTALRRRQVSSASEFAPLIEALCSKVHGLRRLRFSSLEPGDLNHDLLQVMRSHAQIVPHFHLPLQSGSDAILRRMNRQYSRSDFLRMIDEVHAAYDQPAITTDIIVGFPSETDEEFAHTLDVVDRTKFIHIHAFSFSPRPGTAAARWTDDFVHGPVVNERINLLAARGLAHSLEFRNQFIGQTVEVLVERPRDFDTLRHGRSERYFDVHFEDSQANAGDAVRLCIDRVSPQRTFGSLVR